MRRRRLRVIIAFFAGAGALAGVLSAAARAADFDLLSPRKVGLSPVSTDWTGWYIGGEGGTGWGTDQLFFPAPMTRTSGFDTSGTVAGGTIGYNVQVPAGDWVFGVETNIDWADIKGNAACPNIAYSCATKLTELISGSGRIGYAWGSALFYVKGGFAVTREQAYPTLLTTGRIPASGVTNRGGYTIGTGIEYMLAPNWAVKAEYDYYSFDSKRMTLITPSGAADGVTELASRSVNSFKAGINYHFNWHPPFVLARY